MKIAVGTIFEEYGGVSRHIRNIRRYSSHRVSIVPSRPVRILLNRCRWVKPHYKRFIEQSRLDRYDILHSHADPWFERVCRASRSQSCKWVHTFHSLFFAEDYESGLVDWQIEENQALIEWCSQADLRICVSPWLHEFLQKKYQISTHVIENGIDPAIHTMAKADRFVRRYGMDRFILYVGGIREVKNPLFFKRLAERMPDHRFVMVGERLDEASFRSAYHCDIPRNLHLIGAIRYPDVLDAMAAARAYVMTSKRESMPYTLLESMALGKPVVAPDHSGPRDVLAGTGAGFLYHPDSLDDAADKIGLALDSQTVGLAARERIEENYHISKQIRKLDELYQSLV